MKLRFEPETFRQDLDEISRYGKQRKPILRALHARIRKLPSALVDERIMYHARIITATISCTDCGNCCRNLEPAMSAGEAYRLAMLEQPDSPENWVSMFTEAEPGNAYRIMRSTPCCLLSQNRCRRYEDRPGSCADYPHLSQPGQKYRFRSTLAQYEVCPIVYLTLEALVAEFNIEAAELACEN